MLQEAIGFLSDLCGREVYEFPQAYIDSFLSDLCGREVNDGGVGLIGFFLSDLCGREEVSNFC